MTFSVIDRVLHVETALESPPRVETMDFPVANIARVLVAPNRPDYSRAVLEFLVGLAILGLLLAAVGDAADDLVGLFPVAAALLTGRLVVVLLSPRYYVLLVETTGPPFARLESRNHAEVTHLARSLVWVINHPRETFHYQAEHLHIGDTIKLIGGSGNTGKAIR